jgi:hypothetical protein
MTAGLFSLPKAVRIKSSGVPHAGALAYFYQTGTTNPKDVFTDAALSIRFQQPVQADSEGQFPPIYYDQSQVYKLKLTTSSGTQIDVVDPAIIGPLTDASFLEIIDQDFLTPLLNPRTSAEIAAGITPANYSFLPGDIRRYGAVSDGAADCSVAFAAAIAQATTSTADRASVYIPVTQQGFKIVTGATATGAPFQIIGGVSYYSYLWTSADIALLTIQNVQQLQGVHIANVGFISTHGAPTKAGVHFKNSSYCRIIGGLIQGFFYNVRYEPTATSPSSCFNCSIEDSSITGCIGANSFNIYAGTATNHLNLRNVTAGGTALGGALYLTDSIGLNWNGGDAESCGGPVSVDIDSTSDIRMAAKISGVDFEASSNSSGVIRIGNTALVRNVEISSNGFVNGAASAYLINPVRCDQLTVFNNAADTGTSTGFFIRPSGTTQTNFFVKANTWQNAYAALTYSASMTPHAGTVEVSTVTITDNSAFTVNAPDGCAWPGLKIGIWFINSSGGAHGTGTISAYKAGGAFPAISSGNRRRFDFEFDGTNWSETYRSPADISN